MDRDFCKLADLYGVTVYYLLGRSVESGSMNAPMEKIDASTLPALQGKPVWSFEHGRGIVNYIQNHVLFTEGIKIPFDELLGLDVLPPSFTFGYHPVGTPVSHEDLVKHTQLWIEPILPDSFSRDELRGFYKFHTFYAENEYVTRFMFDTYGSKRLAFEQKL